MCQRCLSPQAHKDTLVEARMTHPEHMHRSIAYNTADRYSSCSCGWVLLLLLPRLCLPMFLSCIHLWPLLAQRCCVGCACTLCSKPSLAQGKGQIVERLDTSSRSQSRVQVPGLLQSLLNVLL